MKALLIFDRQYENETLSKILSFIKKDLDKRDYKIECIGISDNQLQPCKGCFGCWLKKPGECVISDCVKDINKKSMQSDVVFYISPIVYGQFSANISNAFISA